MSPQPFHQLSMRERQIMEVLHRLGPSGAAAVADQLPDGASYDSVRVTLSILEKKGHVSHSMEGRRYIYSPAERPDRARSRMVRHLLKTFFHDSAPQAVSSLLDVTADKLTDADLDELMGLIQAARKKKAKR